MHPSGLLFLSNLFSTDMLVIVFFALLLFGGEKLPEIARGIGKGIRDFKDASDGIKREINNQIYSFEEKREEDKKIEDAIVANQLATQKKDEASSSALIENNQQVENTIPVSTGYIHNGETQAEVNNVSYNETLVEDRGADVINRSDNESLIEDHGAEESIVTNENTKNL